MTRFWGKLFGINFALGVTTGITMEFQFGTNWAYYSHYVGDIFGAPLAIEGLMAFFLEIHLHRPVLLRLGPLVQEPAPDGHDADGHRLQSSALWILIANGWMQNPVGAEFNYQTMRMEMTDFWAVRVQPRRAGQVRAHRVGRLRHRLDVRAGDLGWYLLKGRDIEFAKRSFRIAAASASPRAVGDRAGRRIRLHRRRGAADQDGGHRGDVGDRAGAAPV